MMAIVGEPSADGLVMEPIDVVLGPLRSPLPAGLVVHITLDGDVVDECTVHASRRRFPAAPGGTLVPPDELAPLAWDIALSTARETGAGDGPPPSAHWLRPALVEIERAVSHTAWLRSLGRLLAWPPLVSACTTSLGPLLEARAVLTLPDSSSVPGDAAQGYLAAAGTAVAELGALRRSRRLRSRTGGRGTVSTAEARGYGLRGPSARASGLAEDARVADPVYAELGFTPAIRTDGDALARILMRVDELSTAVALTRRALERARANAEPPVLGVNRRDVLVEGPRGPLQVTRQEGRWRLSATGESAARLVAAGCARGLEWASALVVLASFDLSPWTVRE